MFYLEEEVYFLFAGFQEQLTKLNINYSTLQYIADCVAHADFETDFIQSVIPARTQNWRSQNSSDTKSGITAGGKKNFKNQSSDKIYC